MVSPTITEDVKTHFPLLTSQDALQRSIESLGENFIKSHTSDT